MLDSTGLLLTMLSTIERLHDQIKDRHGLLKLSTDYQDESDPSDDETDDSDDETSDI